MHGGKETMQRPSPKAPQNAELTESIAASTDLAPMTETGHSNPQP